MNNISWGNAWTNYNCAGDTSVPSGNLASDPQLCSDNISVNYNSPCTPWKNPWGVWIGCGRVGGLWGTLEAGPTIDNNINPSQKLEIPSNAVLPSSVNLTIGSNRTVTCSAGTKLEIAGGALELFFTTFQKAAGGGPWQGIVVSGGSLEVTSSTIKDAEIGIDFSGASAGTGGGVVTLSTVTQP